MPAAPDDPQYEVITGRRRFGFIWKVNARARTMRTITVRFSADEVLDLRVAARAGQDADRPPASSGDALGAHLWRVLGALRGRDPAAQERLGIVVGLRAALKDRLPDGYWGNAVSNTTAALPARELREEPLAHTVAAVRAALDRVTLDRIRQEAAFLEAQRAAGRSGRVFSRMSLDAFEGTVALNNVSRLPVYAVEFGAGRPFWFAFPASPIPWTVLITPTPDDDHSRDVHLSVPGTPPMPCAAPSGPGVCTTPAGVRAASDRTDRRSARWTRRAVHQGPVEDPLDGPDRPLPCAGGRGSTPRPPGAGRPRGRCAPR